MALDQYAQDDLRNAFTLKTDPEHLPYQVFRYGVWHAYPFTVAMNYLLQQGATIERWEHVGKPDEVEIVVKVGGDKLRAAVREIRDELEVAP